MIFFMGAILNADGRRAIMVMPQLALLPIELLTKILLAFAQIKLSHGQLNWKDSAIQQGLVVVATAELARRGGCRRVPLVFASTQRGSYSNASIDTPGI
jgi:hypothetical protein